MCVCVQELNIVPGIYNIMIQQCDNMSLLDSEKNKSLVNTIQMNTQT